MKKIQVIFFLFLSFGLLAQGPVLHYSFSNNTNDVSGSDIQGSLINGGTYVSDRSGTALSALDLDGNTQYVSVNNSNQPIISGNAITFAGWYKLREYRANSFVLSTPGVIAIFNENGFPQFAPQDASISNILTYSSAVPLDTWTHFVGTYDGSVTRIYIDGAEVASEQIDKTMSLTSLPTQVGGNASTNFPGSIDEIRIYDRALSSAEVLELYQSETDQLIVQYTFSGDATDQSGNGNDGGVTGAILAADRFGDASTAYSFNGTSEITINTGTGVQLTNDFTYNLWVNPSSYTSGGASLIEDSGGGGASVDFLLQETGEIRGDTYTADGINTSSQIPLGTWSMVTLKRSGSVLTMYIDGVFASSGNTSSTGSPFPSRIGTSFNGSIDDVSIYNRALSSEEISNLHSQNDWPILSVEITGTALTGAANSDVVALRRTNNSFYLSRYLYDGTLRFQANGNATVNWGDDELDGVGEQDGADIPVTEGLYAIRLEPSDNSYFITEITSVGFLGSARTGDLSGWDPPDTDMEPIGLGTFQLNDVKLFDGDWKIRANDTWTLMDWGGPGDGTFDIFGADIPVAAGTYDITVSTGISLNYSITNVQLVADYPLSGSAIDASTNSNDGVVNGATPTTDRFGNTGSAYTFDGVNDRITLPFTSQSLGNEMTISAWVYRTKSNGTNVNQGIVSNDENLGSRGVLFGIIGGTGGQALNASFTNDLGSFFSLTGNVVPESTWKHYVMSYDGSTLRLYEDGVEVNSVPASGDIGGTNNFVIGHDPFDTDGGRYFGGNLDDIRFYNRALSLAEVESLYRKNNWLAPKFSGLFPSSGAAGSTVRIYGNNLNESGVVVNIGGEQVTPTSNSKRGLFFTLPDVPAGSYDVTVSSTEGVSRSHHFNVLKTKTSTLSFSSQQISASIDEPHDIHMADFNGDNYPDLLTYSFSDSDLLYFANDQTGGFPTSARLYDGPNAADEITTIVSGDLDHDGDLDVAMFNSTQILWFAYDGSGIFGPANVAATGSNFRDLALGDIDNDGFLDIVTVENGVSQWYENDGSGVFGAKQIMIASPVASKMSLNDFDNNAVLDGAFVNTTNFYLRESSGNFVLNSLDAPTNGSDAVVTGDLNGDDFIDIVTGSFNDHNVDLFLNNNGTGFGSTADLNSSDTYTSAFDLDMGDLDGDGDLDLLVAFFGGSGSLVMYENDGTASFADLEIDSSVPTINRVLTTDMDNDGDLDIVTAREDGFIHWFENQDVDTQQTVADLKFDGSLNDDSGFGNNGTITSGAIDLVLDRFDNPNHAIDLPAGQGVDIGNDAEINLATGFTLNMWLNPVNNNNAGGIFESVGSFHQHIYTTHFDWRYFQGTTEFPIDGIPVVVPNGTWTMFTWTYDGTNMRFYENSELKYTEAVSGDIDVTSNSYVIADGFDGSVDDFIWVDGVLSNQEIRALYNDDLIVEYKFDGNANDATNNGRDATVNGTDLTTDRFGSADSAYEFDGTDDIDAPSFSEKPENITISTWFNYPEGGADNTHYMVDLQGVASLVLLSGKIQATFRMGAGFTSTSILPNSIVASPDEWHHAAVTFDGSSIDLYLDGQLALEGPTTDPIIYDNSSFEIRVGRPEFNPQDFFTGSLDEVRIHNRALSQDEILELYHESNWDIADFKSFAFLQQAGPARINVGARTIEIEVTNGSNISSLIPNFSLSAGASAEVNGISQASGVSANDFSSPVIYEVTGSDGTITSWVVTVTEEDLLEAYYPFNGNADDEIGGFNGTLRNGPVLIPDRFGNANSAFSFDGNDDFITTDFEPSADNGPFTLSYWAYWDAQNVSFREMIGFTDDAETQPAYFGVNDVNKIRAIADLDADMPVQQWTHLVFTHDGGTTLNLHIDGELAFSSNSLASFTFGPLAIGAFSRNGGENWNGDLDDIRFYGRVISDDEIQDLLHEGGWIPENKDVVANYDFVGNSNDISGNGFDGVPDSAPSDPSPTTDRFGDANSAYYFDGDDLIHYSNTNSYDFGDEMTVVAWINSSAYTATEPQILANSGFDFKLTNGSSDDSQFRRLKAEVFTGGNFLNTGDLALNEWYHVAFTYKRNQQFSLYLNGAEIGTTTPPDLAIPVSASQLVSGAAGMDGVIDDLTIYDVALPAESIQELYLATGNLSSDKELISFSLSTGGTPSSTSYTSLGSFDGSRYYVSTSGALWNAAKAAAEALGGHLATIQSQSENDFLSNALGSSAAWIGGSDEQVEGTYRWVDGSPFDYENWATDEPNGSTGENFIEFLDNGEWNDLADGSVPYVVEIPFYTGTINSGNKSVSVEVPFGTDITSLVPTFTLSDDASAKIGSTTQQSSVSVSDFTDPVRFSVFAQDLSSQDYVINVTVDDGLVAFYPFNGDANNEAGNGNNGIVNGATSTADRFGDTGSAYTFNGTSDYIDGGEANFFSAANQTSISFWFNTNSVSADQDIIKLTQGTRIRLRSDGFLDLELGTFAITPSFAVSVNASEWIHAVLTYRDTDELARLYINGAFVDDDTGRGNLVNGGQFLIGSLDGTTSFMDGAIDDIRLYNRAISSDEVLALYNEGGWPVDNTDTDFLSFSVPEQAGLATINTTDHTISLEVTSGTSLTNLVPIFTLPQGATAQVGGVTQVSEVTSNDFTTTVSYVVTAQDGTTTQSWDVTITEAPSNATDITAFSFPEESSTAVIDDVNHTVDINVEEGSDLTTLVAAFSLSSGATATVGGVAQVSGTTANDFSSDVTYTIAALDGTTTQDWTISVTETSVLLPTITSFSPTSGPVGTSVTIAGTNFDLSTANNIVYFGVAQAAVTSASSTELVVNAPVGATYKPITVLVNGLTAYSSAPFITTFADGSITSSSFDTKVDFTTGMSPYYMSIGDLDGDGKTDLVVPNYDDDMISIFRNTSVSGTIGTSSFSPKIDLDAADGPTAVSIGDLDGDGKLDLAVVNWNGGTVSVFRNTSVSGTISFASRIDFTTGSNPFSVAIGDLDGDGKADMAVANRNSNTVSVFRNTSVSGTMSFTSKLDFATGANPLSVSIGDLDGDGKEDMAVTNFTDNSVSVFRNTSISGTVASGSFSAKVDFATGSEPYSVSIGDLDGDGKADMAVANRANGSISVFRNTSVSGTPSFESRVDFDTGTAPWSVSIGDLDGDGKPDLATGNEGSDNVSVLKNISVSGTLSFSSAENFTAVSDTRSVSIGDLDGDGKADLVASNYGIGSVSVFRNVIVPPQPSTFTNNTPDQYLADDGALGMSVTVSDVNGLAAVNVYYKKVSADVYKNTSMSTNDDAVYTLSLGGGEIDNTGVQYYFEAVDAGADVTRSDDFLTSLVVADDGETIPSVTAGTTIQSYSIIAFPYQSFSSNLLVDDLGTYNTSNWRLLRYSGSSYQDLNQFNTLSPGVGYWFIVKEETTINVGGQSVEVDNNGIFTINLSSGYNLIGNPFKGTLNWSIVVQHNITQGVIQSGDIESGNSTTLDGWNTTWVDRTSLSPYEGGFVNMVNAVSNFEIPISALNGTGGREATTLRVPQEVFIDESEWEMRFFFSTPSYTYSMGGIGMHPEAQDADDPHDKGLLPKFLLYLDQEFSDGNTRSVKQTDYYKQWSFKLPNNLDEDYIDLTWDMPVSSGKTIMLVDGASRKLYNLKNVQNVTLPNNPEATHYLYYGDEETIFDRMDLPFNVIAQVYPNPVESEFTLQIYSPEEKIVPIELISIDGKRALSEFVHLHRGMSEQKINLGGITVRDGLYFIKLENEVLTKILKK